MKAKLSTCNCDLYQQLRSKYKPKLYNQLLLHDTRVTFKQNVIFDLYLLGSFQPDFTSQLCRNRRDKSGNGSHKSGSLSALNTALSTSCAVKYTSCTFKFTTF